MNPQQGHFAFLNTPEYYHYQQHETMNPEYYEIVTDKDTYTFHKDVFTNNGTLNKVQNEGAVVNKRLPLTKEIQGSVKRRSNTKLAAIIHLSNEFYRIEEKIKQKYLDPLVPVDLTKPFGMDRTLWYYLQRGLTRKFNELHGQIIKDHRLDF